MNMKPFLNTENGYFYFATKTLMKYEHQRQHIVETFPLKSLFFPIQTFFQTKKTGSQKKKTLFPTMKSEQIVEPFPF